MNKTYTLVGSRSTPEPILELLTAIATKLAKDGYIMRSGHAAGADQAGEKGCDAVIDQFGIAPKQIFLPYPGFNPGGESWATPEILMGQPTQSALYQAEGLLGQQHWDSAGMKANLCFGRNAHARNFHQVNGKHLDSPSRFLICWAEPDKSSDPTRYVKGGTNTAVRIAMLEGIPVFNLYHDDVRDRLTKYVKPARKTRAKAAKSNS